MSAVRQYPRYPLAPVTAVMWALRQAANECALANPDHPYHWLTQQPEPDISPWIRLLNLHTAVTEAIDNSDPHEVTLAGIRTLAGAR